MMKYVIAVLVSMVIGLGGYTAILSDKLVKQEAMNTVLIDIANKAEKEVMLTKASCTITQEIVQEQHVEEKAADKVQENAVEKLRSLPATIVREKTDRVTMEKNGGFADDARISPDVKRLLDEAYCYGNPNDSACPAR